MKNKFFKITGFIAFAAMVIILPGCLKENNATYTDFSKTGETVILQNSGLGNFKAANVSPAAADTIRIELVAQLNSEYPIGTDINVSLDVDDAKRTTYNTANNTNFLLMTPAMFKIISKKLVIKAGKRIDITFVEIYTAAINAQSPDKSWMLPISIIDASGKPLTSNFNTMYVNVIGNPLAGTYVVTGIRYNYNGGPAGNSGVFNGNPANIPQNYTGTTAIPSPKVASPIDGNSINIDFANLGGNGYQYILTQVNNFASISIGFNDVMLNGDSNINTWLVSYTAPTATTKAKFRIITQYVNNFNPAVGNDRILDETFTQQ